jgi:hypothetical protein
MMSFLTYITGSFMNFELLPILTDFGQKSESPDTILEGAIQGSFQKSLVAIGPVVSEEKIFM